tara:strand:- start:105 stop:824 length:720 start_codon:yes stop_codon:yes gene_type:complete
LKIDVNKNKIIAITGSSKGIGLGIAKHFLSLGYTVAGCSRSESDFEKNNYFFQKVDVKEEKEVRNWIKSIKNKYNRIDVLICNAGLVKSSLLMPVTSTKILNDFMNVHIKGTFLACRETSKIMIQQKYGRIINISSPAVSLLLEGASAYGASKAAVENMSKVFAKELAPMGITCNLIRPGLIETEITKSFGSKWKNNLIKKQTIKSTFEIEELCYIIEFLIGPKSSNITGQVISMGLVA